MNMLRILIPQCRSIDTVGFPLLLELHRILPQNPVCIYIHVLPIVAALLQYRLEVLVQLLILC